MTVKELQDILAKAPEYSEVNFTVEGDSEIVYVDFVKMAVEFPSDPIDDVITILALQS